jgi:hypothetical protein
VKRLFAWVGGCALGAAAAAPAAAEDWAILGARARGMGGAGIATEISNYWNPASIGMPVFGHWESEDESDPLAKRMERRAGGGPKEFGFGLTGSGQFEMASIGNIAQEVDDIADLYFNTDFAAVQDRLNTGTATAADLQVTLQLVKQIQDLDQEGVGIYGTAVAESGVWVHTDVLSVGVFARGVGYAGIDPVVDWSFGAASAFADGGFGEVFASTGAVNSPTTTAGASFSTQLQAVGVSVSEANELAFQAELAGVPLSDAETVSALVKVAQATVAAGSSGTATSLDTLFFNQSGFWLRGIVVKEGGVTLARSHTIFGVKWSLGASFKFVEAISNQNLIAVSRFQDGEQAFDKLLDDWNRTREVSTSFGIDAGLMCELPIGLRFGVTGRNLNRPSFAWAGGQSYYLERQWRAGAAWSMGPLTLAFDADLWVTQTRLVDRYGSQFVNGGIEFAPARQAPIGLAFRFGAYKNVAEPTEDVVYSFGLGLRLGPIRVDAAVSATYTTTNVENAEDSLDEPSDGGNADFEELYPERFGASAVIQISYPF